MGKSFTSLRLMAVAFLLGSLVATYAHQGDTERVSVSPTGEEGNNYAAGYTPALSTDGRFVAFTSLAANLAPGDTNSTFDVFVRDRLLGTTECVSVSSQGAVGNAGSYQQSISDDGRFVAFRSASSNLVSGDTNGFHDVFVRDRLLGTTERVSVSTGGAQGNGHSGEWGLSISGNGQFVVFDTMASNLVAGDANAKEDVVIRDRLEGTTELVSVSSSGVHGNGASATPAISTDGRYVAFVSQATNLVEGDSNKTDDVFVRDRLLGSTERVSVSSDGGQANNWSGSDGISLSADGRFVTFLSLASNLVPGDTNGGIDVFVRDRLLGATERVSVSSNGAQGDNNDTQATSGPTISADGRFVAFDSAASNLVPVDTNGYRDVFVHDRLLGTTAKASRSVLGEQGSGDSVSGGISPDGRFVGFVSSSWDFILGDTNGCADVFVNQYGPDDGWPTISGSLATDTGVLPPSAPFVFRIAGGTQAIGMWSPTLGSDGSFVLPAPVGVYDLSVKVTHWLRRTLAGVSTSGGSADVGSQTIANGDADGNNHVGLGDLAWVLGNWASADTMADLDGNGTVGIGDLSVVLANYGLSGDP